MARPARLLLLALLAAALVSATPGSRAAAEAPTQATGHDDRFLLSGRVGVQVFDYREEFGDIESEYTSVGPTLGLTASLRLAERLRLTGDYLGALILEREESWDNVRSAVTVQENDLKVDFHVFDLDVAYAVVRTHRLEWAVAAGWHYYALDFTRSAFRGDSGAIENIGPVDEEVRGQGVKLGTTLTRGLTDRLALLGRLAGYYLYRVDVDNARNGEFESEGVAVRLGLALDYFLTPQVTLGVGYDGHFIAVEEARNPRGILPRNRTWAHTLSGRVGVSF
jgi:hypothetical protein